LLLLSGSVQLVQAQTQDGNRFEVSKQLDIFNALVKEVEMFYVDTLDIEATINKGINSML
jgi:carboxyl-terminal processing protease